MGPAYSDSYNTDAGTDAEERLRQLVRLRGKLARVITSEDEERLLEEAVTRLGVPLERARVTHADVADGATLRLEMGDTPADWGRE